LPHPLCTVNLRRAHNFGRLDTPAGSQPCWTNGYVKVDGDAVMMDRRQFVQAAAAGFSAPMVSSAGDVTAQSSPPSARTLPPDSGLFNGFEARWIRTQGADIFLRHGGKGPPLLLLHGNPLTHASWHKVAGTLASRFHVVAADLRGYGDSVGPAEGGANHVNYSFRAMAQDQVDVMAALGYERFFLAGHDRGARTAHRLALDHPAAVRKVALLDIVPTRYVWEHTTREWALGSWHWPFMAQPEEMFERMIAAIPPREFVVRHLGRTGTPTFFDERALNEYVRCFTRKTIHGSCEDYRAGATIDLEHDNADHRAGRKVSVPTLVLWGRRSGVGMLYGDVLSIWREAATEVTGGPLETGHYPAEEAAESVIDAFERFFV
jgi:haloacetate dehalogenase